MRLVPAPREPVGTAVPHSAAQQGDRTHQGGSSGPLNQEWEQESLLGWGALGGSGEEDIPDGGMTSDEAGTWGERRQEE